MLFFLTLRLFNSTSFLYFDTLELDLFQIWDFNDTLEVDQLLSQSFFITKQIIWVYQIIYFFEEFL